MASSGSSDVQGQLPDPTASVLETLSISSVSPEIRKVLIAVDGSTQAESAFLWYADNLHREGNYVLLLHIVEPPIISSHNMVAVNAELFNRQLEREKDNVKTLTNKFSDVMKSHNIRGRVIGVFSTRPGQVIVDMASNEQVSLVVAGTRGLGHLRKTIMGSVSDYVLHHVKCPVLIYRAKPDE